jgi:hypothetical protein
VVFAKFSTTQRNKLLQLWPQHDFVWHLKQIDAAANSQGTPLLVLIALLITTSGYNLFFLLLQQNYSSERSIIKKIGLHM